MISITFNHTSQAASVRRYLANYASTMGLILFGFFFYTQLSRYHIGQYWHGWEPQWKDWKSGILIDTVSFFLGFVYLYAVGLLGYFAINRETDGKSLVAIKAFYKICFIKSHLLSKDEKQALFACGVKFFFVPFILDAFLAHVMTMNYKICDLYRWSLMDKLTRVHFVSDINHLLFEILFSWVLLFDIVPFVVGYLVESKTLDNKIKSVESTWAGWFFCIMCYPPFNTAFSAFARTDFAEYVSPFPGFGEMGLYVQMTLNAGALVLMAMYASASISLSWKSANLCSRGVVATGLYKYVRHPAYACKNAAWWLFSIGTAIHNSVNGQPFIVPLIALLFWNWIYYMRAYTEELHLARTDPEYLTYMQSVPFRFIPGVC